MIEIVPSGDSILILKNINNKKSLTLFKKIERLNFSEIEDIISLKNSLGILFNPYKITAEDLIIKIQNNISKIKINEVETYKTWEIPICYDEEFAIDIKEISKIKKLNIDEIKKLHLERSYEVQIIGFLPGFLYLGDLNKSLHLPRKNNPRISIPNGSIGIAGNQTGVYNIESPGGWNIIGRTPLKLFNKSHNPPIQINKGDKIIFKEIRKEDFNNYSY